MKKERQAEKMEMIQFMALINLAEKMKNATRHSWTSSGRHESVAEHSWRLALMAYFTKDEFPEADMDKVIRMAIFHDMGEAFTGDIPAFLKTSQDQQEESRKISDWIAALPSPFRGELSSLFEEMEALETQEARIYKALDKMEAVIQHNEADISTWLPLEYDLQMNYGKMEVLFSPYMQKLKAEANRISKEKIDHAEKEKVKKRKENNKMKVAVTYENGQVFQHFGHTQEFKVYEVEEGEIKHQEVVNTNGNGHGALAGFLQQLGVSVLICGGIGGGARAALAEAGIELYPGASGDADAQVKAFLAGNLSYDPNTVCSHHSHEEGHSCHQ